MMRAVFTRLQHSHHRRPSLDIVVDKIFAKSVAQCSAFRVGQPGQLSAGDFRISIIPVAQSDLRKTCARKRIPMPRRRGHGEFKGFEFDMSCHLWTGRIVMADQPIRGREPAPRTQHTKDLSRQKIFVWKVNDGVLGKNHIKDHVPKGKRARRNLLNGQAVRRPRSRDPCSRGLACWRFYIDANHQCRTMIHSQRQRDRPRTTADIKNAFAGQIEPF